VVQKYKKHLEVPHFLYNFAETIIKIPKIMVKHIILWTLNPELSEAEKSAVKAGIKEGLEGLVGKVPGLLDVKVHISEM
jgi:hypothetical protein